MTKKAELEKFLSEVPAGTVPGVLEKLDKYYNWILEENCKINLISRKTDPEDLWTLHFLDSLLSIKCVDYSGKNVLDFGTGGGFPGIPLAVLYPQSHFTMLDSTKKKIQSVRNGAARLALANCSFLDIRLEEVPQKFDGSFDIVVSRSVRIEPQYKKVLLRLLKDDGLIVLYKSQNLDDAAQFPKVSVTDVSMPLIGERKIVIIRKSDCV